MAEFFPEIPKIEFEGPQSKNPLAVPSTTTPTEVVEGQIDDATTAVQRLLLAHVPRHRQSTRSARRRCTGRGTTAPTPSTTPEARATSPSSSSEARRAVLLLPRPRRRARRADAAASRTRTSTPSPRCSRRSRQRPASSCSGARPTCSRNPRFMHGAATSCNADVFAFAAAQVKKAMEVTHELGGENYVFWGGREGYQNLLQHRHEARTRSPRRFLHMAVDYAKKIGFNGQFLHRAQAEGADQAPVRLRRRRVHQLPARSTT